MIYEGHECKYTACVCSDGRLYYGGWTDARCIPETMPENMVAFDTFPTDETAIDGGSNYKWDGERLIYDPVSDEERERRRQESLAEHAAKYGSGGDA